MKKNIMILFIIGISVLALFVYFQFPKSEEKKENYESVSIEDSVVQKLYDMANPSESGTTMLDIYKKETFSNEFLLGASFVTLLKENPNHENIITEEELNLYINKIFGNVTYAHSTGFIVSPILCNFKYDKINHNYTILPSCNEESSTKIVKKLVGAKKNDTEYILTEKVILTKNIIEEEENKEEKRNTLKIYGDVFENNLVKEIQYEETEEEPTIKIEDYLEIASTYEYHFVFDGNSFVYKSIRKVG